jgi:hypothetical protein
MKMNNSDKLFLMIAFEIISLSTLLGGILALILGGFIVGVIMILISIVSAIMSAYFFKVS